MPRKEFIESFVNNEPNLEWVEAHIASGNSYSETLQEKKDQILEAQGTLLEIEKQYKLAVNDLKNINLVAEFITPENTTMIELSLHEDEHHHHLFCKSCGDVIDIELSLGFEQKLSNEIKSIEKNLFFTIEDHGLELFGQCSECRDSF